MHPRRHLSPIFDTGQLSAPTPFRSFIPIDLTLTATSELAPSPLTPYPLAAVPNNLPLPSRRLLRPIIPCGRPVHPLTRPPAAIVLVGVSLCHCVSRYRLLGDHIIAQSPKRRKRTELARDPQLQHHGVHSPKCQQSRFFSTTLRLFGRPSFPLAALTPDKAPQSIAIAPFLSSLQELRHNQAWSPYRTKSLCLPLRHPHHQEKTSQPLPLVRTAGRQRQRLLRLLRICRQRRPSRSLPLTRAKPPSTSAWSEVRVFRLPMSREIAATIATDPTPSGSFPN